jgi:hypothetical protein
MSELLYACWYRKLYIPFRKYFYSIWQRGRSFDRIAFFQNSFFPFKFCSFKKGARQNLHRRSSGARRRQIVVCRQRARRLPSTGPTYAVNGPDKIYTGVHWEPDGGKLSSAFNGPDVCCQRTRQNLNRCLTVANCCLPSTSQTSAVNGPDVCRQRTRQTKFKQITQCLPLMGPASAVNGPDVCRQRTRQTKFKQIMQCLPLTGLTSAIDRLDVFCQGARHLPPTCTMSAINWLKICYRSSDQRNFSIMTSSLFGQLVRSG